MERESGDPTPVDLAAEIHGIVTEGPNIFKKEFEEKVRKAEEERQRLEGEQRERNSESNKLLEKEVQELGLRELFSETRDALVQHYPGATVREEWDGKYEKMSDEHRHWIYRIVLIWETKQQLSSREVWYSNVIEDYYYTEAVYTRIDKSHGAAIYISRDFEIGLRRYEFSELQNINQEKLKRELLEGIASPKRQYREYHPKPSETTQSAHG